ncbi:hypothetical protein PG994_005465 [Apiospora phragmitis]|uniref:BZIP domain-containing protein n=1 Tax=Apiospora phragmitis TaxID=2905665 RepID=A0ABR1VCC1_9PEZI
MVQRLIRDEFKDFTIIMVAHRIESVADADMVGVMEAGRLVRFGPPGMVIGTDVRVPADREANRRSQQQARQRQREYVAGLESRLAEHESRGVQATMEVQRAARAVAATNEKLLALLKMHGVQEAEIDAFLREPSPRGGNSQYRQTIPVLFLLLRMVGLAQCGRQSRRLGCRLANDYRGRTLAYSTI